MSPSNISSFVGDLVAMAQATEELPKAQQTIADLQRQLDDAQRHNQGLEQNILGYKERIDNLVVNLRAANDQRDDIELKMLELEDKNNAVSKFLGSLMGDANSLRNVIDPPKPEPVPTPVHNDGLNPETSTMASGDAIVAGGASPADVSQAVTGQSEPFPPVSGPETNTEHSSTVTNDGMSHSSEVSVNPEPSWAEPPQPTPADSSQRFANMMYEDYAHWVPRSEWIAGGGTDFSYDYRKPDHYSM